MEEWKEVIDYPGYYVSSEGRVKKVNDGVVKYLKISSAIYSSIQLRNSNGRRSFLLHRLIMQTFCPVDNSELEVNHKDLNKLNNRLSNLEWVTHKENMDHAVTNGALDFRFRKGYDNPNYGKPLAEETKLKMSESHNKNGDHPNYKLTDQQVADIKKRRYEGTDIQTLAQEYNQTQANISLICSGKRRSKVAPQYTMVDRIRVDLNGTIQNR